MNDKISEEQAEVMIKLLRLQKQALLEKIQAIQNNADLSPEDQLQALAELLNPVGKAPNEGL